MQVHIYLPEQDHPAHDTVRVIVKDSDDEYKGNPSRVWVDSDAFVGSNDLRNTPRNNFTDGQWHMVTVTSQPNGKKVRLCKHAHIPSSVPMDMTMRLHAWPSCSH